jgi:hypothetical protein
MKNRKDVVEEVLLEYPKARKIPVENFLFSLPAKNPMYDLMNLERDAWLYKWSKDIVNAISMGIDLIHEHSL